MNSLPGTVGWSGLSPSQEYGYASQETSSTWLYTPPKCMSCGFFTAFSQLHQFTTTFLDTATLKTFNLLSSSPIHQIPTSSSSSKEINDYHTWIRRDFLSSFDDNANNVTTKKGSKTQSRKPCNSTEISNNGTKVADCINDMTRTDIVWVSIGCVLIVIGFILFSVGVVQCLRNDFKKDNKKAATTTSVLQRNKGMMQKRGREEQASFHASSGLVGLGRGLGSDGVGKESRSVSLGKQEMDLGMVGSGDDGGLIASSWNEAVPKRMSSSAWRRLLRQSVCFTHPPPFSKPP